ARNESHKLKLGHRTHPSERASKRCTDDRGLGNRRVNHSRRSEAIDEAFRHFERTAVDANVFADAEDAGVTVHLFPTSLPDRLKVSQLRHDRESLLRSCTGDCRVELRSSQLCELCLLCG